MARSGCGISPVESSAIRDGVSHRLAISWIDAVVRGGVHMLSVYFRDSEGLSESNQAILEIASIALFLFPWPMDSLWRLELPTTCSP